MHTRYIVIRLDISDDNIDLFESATSDATAITIACDELANTFTAGSAYIVDISEKAP